MFIDEAKVILRAGDGGHGCVSFRREKFIPKGGPDGGNGGKGGDVVLLCDRNEGDLETYRWQPHRSAKNGTPGMGRQCAGPDGTDLVLRVPPGTQVMEEATGRLVAEVTEHGERVVLLAGGKGGLGNMNFKSSVNQAPRRSTPGYPGEKGDYRFVLKTIADIGLVGFPNAGKSTLTNLITAARPKTAPYPFTTLHVNVGVIEYPDRHGRVVMADIPGLIEGAHENRGLGHQFLRHIERCSLLVFLIDMAGSDGRRPSADFKVLERELRLYSPVLASKPRLVVANKMDLPSAAANLQDFSRKVSSPVLAISCHDGEGLEAFKETVWKAVRKGVLPVSSARPTRKKSSKKAVKKPARRSKAAPRRASGRSRRR
ncbi:MAG: GTPase ObgE [Opitutia bacterium]